MPEEPSSSDSQDLVCLQKMTSAGFPSRNNTVTNSIFRELLALSSAPCLTPKMRRERRRCMVVVKDPMLCMSSWFPQMVMSLL
ncbi:hypothetical protein ScPMuIL_001396 [Solemya velum]